MSKVTDGDGIEAFRPKSPVDWTKIVLSILLAILTLLMGRVWGEQAVARQLSENTTRLSVMERRLDDHFQTANRQWGAIEQDLRDIRMALGAGERQ